MLKIVAEQHTRLAEAFEAADSAQLSTANPIEEFDKIMPTIGDAVIYIMTGHEATHIGQLSAWRRAQGMGPIF